MASDSANVFDAVKKLAVAGRPLQQNEERDVARLAEATKALLDETARDMISKAQTRPVLFSYQGDGTPLKLKHAFQVAFAEHHKHARSGYTGEELYCQGAFVRTLDGAGEPVVTCLLRDPRPMIGKSALHAFNALAEFFPTLDQLHHDGFNIHHYSWDRALFSACKRYSRQYHTTVLRRLCDTCPRQTGTMRVLKSWLLCTGCGLHDIHNGFSWGISKLLQGSGMLDELYIVLESLRNGYSHLQSHLSSFLTEHVVFEDIDVGEGDLFAFWVALDVPPELSSMLAERGVFWREGRLHVKKACQHDEEIMPWLYSACMTVFRFKKFSSSRWITIGSCLRTLVAALALGLMRLVQVTLEDPKVSSYYLGGFKKLSAAMRRFCAVAAISSRPTEALSLAMLEDDRAVRNIVSYEACLKGELEWMEQLGEPVWLLLEHACASGSSCTAIRSDCLDCAHTSLAYSYKNFLDKVRSMPWCIAIGDVDANLEAFAASTEPVDDPVAKKIKTLLGMNFSRPQLVEAVSMFRDCRWSTAFAEQLHAQAAVLHKLHREYGSATLCSRTMVSLLKLLVGTDPAVLEQQKAKKKLTLLGKKQPEKASGRSHFVGAFATEAKQAMAPDRSLTPEETQAIWAAGGKRWDGLAPPQKRAFDSSAGAEKDAKRAKLEEDKRKVRSDLALAQMRAAQERSHDGVVSRLSSCRLSDTQRHRLQQLFDTLADVRALRVKAMLPLDTPPQHVVDAMASVKVPPSTASQTVPEEWVKRICKHRDSFSQTILMVASNSQKRFYHFAYASQSPMDLNLCPLQVVASSACFSGSSCRAISVPSAVHCASYQLSPGTYTFARSLKLAYEEYVYVIPSAGWLMGSAELHGDSRDAVYYRDFLKGLPEPQTAGQSSESTRTKRQEDMLKANPWLAQAIAKKVVPMDEPDEKEAQEEDEEGDIVSEDMVAQVMARLAAKRTEFQHLHDGPAHDFDVYLRKEYGSRGSAEAAADACTAEALSSAQQWCRQHSLHMSSTYSFSKCGGEQSAHKLAHEWCRKMQHLLDASKTAPTPVNWPSLCGSYPRDEAFEQWVDNSTNEHVRVRAAQISSILPL